MNELQEYLQNLEVLKPSPVQTLVRQVHPQHLQLPKLAGLPPISAMQQHFVMRGQLQMTTCLSHEVLHPNLQHIMVPMNIA